MSAADLQRKEENALDALITASLRCTEAEVSEAELARFGDPQIELTPEDEAAIRARSVEEIFMERSEHSTFIDASHELGEANSLSMAMNRKNAEDCHSEETQKELDRKRQEALTKLKARKKRDGTK